MRKHSGHRRLVRGLGGFMSAALIAGSLAIGVGGGVASAQEVDSQGVVGSGATLFPGGQPNNIRQNTQGRRVVSSLGIPTVPQGAGPPVRRGAGGRADHRRQLAGG